MFIDTHAHISCKELEVDVVQILERAKKAKLEAIINVSCAQEDLRPNIEWSMLHTSQELPIYNTIGYHPDRFNEPLEQDTNQQIISMMQWLEETYTLYKNHIIAIGECGLDYYRTFHRTAQIALFRAQLSFAKEKDLPVVIHLRGDMWDDFFEIINEYKNIRGVIHCFGGNLAEAKKLLNYPNLMISFTGIITFKNAIETYRPILEHVPLERMLIETDSPYLAPTPYRGKINEPSYVVEVAKQIAMIKNTSLDEVEAVTTTNAKRLFGIL